MLSATPHAGIAAIAQPVIAIGQMLGIYNITWQPRLGQEIRSIPTVFAVKILDNRSATPMWVLPEKYKGKTMTDQEVARLRRLRDSALQVRAIARALGSTRWAWSDPLLSRIACSSWRIARTVSGRLRAHPYVRYQKDVSVGSLVRNSVRARLLALSTRSRMKALVHCESQLRQLARQLDDARALTWTPDLSDTFGRLQIEIKSLIAALAHQTALAHGTKRAPDSERFPKRAAVTEGRPAIESGVGDLAPPVAVDWPYLAF